MPCESRQKGAGGRQEGRRRTQRQREVHMGVRVTKKVSWTFPVQIADLCVFTFQRRALRPRASECRGHVTMWEEEGATETVN